MGFDAILKRYFPAIVCVLIAIAAYFQASGMGQLVASNVSDGAAPAVGATAPTTRAPASVPANQDHATSAGAILSRNPFDSVTGPLDGKPVSIEDAPVAEVRNQEDPYDDPPCDGTKVVLISQSEDPEWSFAAFAASDGKTQMRRQGDEINGKTVYYVGWDRVWLTAGAGGARCQTSMRDKNVAPPKAAATTPADTTKRGRGRKVPADIASKIHKVSETEFSIERSVVDQILENQAELMRSARIVPEKEGDKVVGIRLFGVRPDSLLGTLGLQNGDRLQSINGFEMSDPQKALEAYARLRSADKLSVNVQRKGSPMTLDFNIK
ncbi:type II secretion system protein GspC [Chondromyces apiculatus]|uniref:General secretion pathway protein C n=1 Tax=Chondromyces apiculatus DSM 436 TaxID=1192034 RepID=A0A017T128_9BACT|nr:type II secretion system protein GspC [Chondromyces apiculatus]EYF02928.1 General secretion pathway protein C [Chondromyces apiculatus DSM 436]